MLSVFVNLHMYVGVMSVMLLQQLSLTILMPLNWEDETVFSMLVISSRYVQLSFDLLIGHSTISTNFAL